MNVLGISETIVLKKLEIKYSFLRALLKGRQIDNAQFEFMVSDFFMIPELSNFNFLDLVLVYPVYFADEYSNNLSSDFKKSDFSFFF